MLQSVLKIVSDTCDLKFAFSWSPQGAEYLSGKCSILACIVFHPFSIISIISCFLFKLIAEGKKFLPFSECLNFFIYKSKFIYLYMNVYFSCQLIR